MYWKKFKNMERHIKLDESNFIVGIDLGNDSSAIAYFNTSTNSPEIIDITGGYGKPSIPTVIQYIPDTKEWVFGEYAVLNKTGREITFNSLIDRLGKMEYAEVDGKPVSVVSILGLFIKEFLGNIKNINPKAEVVGIVVSIPSYFTEEAKEELLRALSYAGYEKEVIGLFTDRECIFSRYFYEKEASNEKIMLIDFGSREVRGGVYEVSEVSEDKINIKSLSSLFDKSIGTKKVNSLVRTLFTSYYADNVELSNISQQEKENLEIFAYQHRDLIFQKSILKKPVRLYFNFAYPPFKKTVSKEEVEETILPFRNKFKSFINEALSKNIYSLDKIDTSSITTVLCIGGGFEMFWAKEVIGEVFNNAKIVYYKNPKGALAEGASILCAIKLDMVNARNISTTDKHQITSDIGVIVQRNSKEKFIPLIEKNSFWWQSHEPKLFIVTESTNNPINIDIHERNSNGDLKKINSILIDKLPKRPKGTTRLSMSLKYKSYNEIIATIKDGGFGEIFPKINFEKTYTFEVR